MDHNYKLIRAQVTHRPQQSTAAMMRSMYLLIISATISNVIAIRCQCTEGYCDNTLHTCYSKYRYCFAQTTGNNTSRGCLEYNDFMASVLCHVNSVKCCDTDFCNGDNSARIQYTHLPVPSVQLASNSRGTITIHINDSAVVRDEIDGYIATAYTTKESGQITKKIKPQSHLFSIDDLQFNTTYVVEVSSYKGDVTSNRSRPITVRTQNAVCAYYSRDQQFKPNNRLKQCKEFWCFSLWTKIGTTPVLLRRGCWNKQLKQECKRLDQGNVLFCACKEEKCLLPSAEQIQV